MIQTKTLNQIVELFKSFATNHMQLNDFGYGPTSEIGTTVKMQFPYLWLSHQQDSAITIRNNTQTPSMRFYVLIMDQQSDQHVTDEINGLDSTNAQEILSDTFQILQDLIATCNTDWKPLGVQISEDVRCYPAIDETQDQANGWVAELTLRLSYANGNCIKPIA